MVYAKTVKHLFTSRTAQGYLPPRTIHDGEYLILGSMAYLKFSYKFSEFLDGLLMVQNTLVCRF
jgi:hypothetical protein